MRVEGHVECLRVLRIQSRDDLLYDSHRRQARHEEAVEPVLRKADGGEERRHNMACKDECRTDGRGVILMVQLVTQGFM